MWKKHFLRIIPVLERKGRVVETAWASSGEVELLMVHLISVKKYFLNEWETWVKVDWLCREEGDNE